MLLNYRVSLECPSPFAAGIFMANTADYREALSHLQPKLHGIRAFQRRLATKGLKKGHIFH
jgi:hypothetical protein